MKKVFDKIINGLMIIWIIPLLRYFVIAMLIGLIIGLIRGTSPLYNIF
jgi:TctA family transporter